MVGLTDLGEVAWENEQVMNRWLERQQPASPELLELIALASAAFREWIGRLRGRESFALDGRAIVERAQKLRAVEPEPEEITVGTTRLARSFFDIYAKEALQHVQTLETQSEASDEFARAAHTLASSSRTAGFGAVADLAAALEHWTPVAGDRSRAGPARTDRAPADAATAACPCREERQGAARDEGRHRPAAAADLPRGSGGPGAAHRQRPARLEGEPLRPEHLRLAAPRPAHAQRQRPDGRRDPARRADAHHRKPDRGGDRARRVFGAAVRRARGEDGPPEPRPGAHGRPPGGAGGGFARACACRRAGRGAGRGAPGRAAAAQPRGAAAGQRRYPRSPDLRVRGDRHRTLAHRGGAAAGEAVAERSERQRRAPAQPAARGRGPGRQPDAIAAVGARGARPRLRSARVRPLYAAAGADADDGREPERRRVDPAVPAEEPGRNRRRPAAAGAHQPRRAAGADAHARGAVLEP